MQHWHRYSKMVCVLKLSLHPSSYDTMRFEIVVKFEQLLRNYRQTNRCSPDIHTLLCYAFQNCRYTRAVIMLCLSKLLTLTLTLTLTFDLDLCSLFRLQMENRNISLKTCWKKSRPVRLEAAGDYLHVFQREKKSVKYSGSCVDFRVFVLYYY